MNTFKLPYLVKTAFTFLLLTNLSCSNEDETINFDENNKSSNIVFSKKNPKSNDNICTPEGNNASRIYTFLNDVNKTTVWATSQIDDRTCAYDYTQETFSGRTHGVYKLEAGTNHIDGLQPRIERALSVCSSTEIGSYTKFTGTVRILEVGDASGTNSDGTYVQLSNNQRNPVAFLNYFNDSTLKALKKKYN